MSRIWLPEPVYAAKPYGALGLGALVGIGSFLRSLTAGSWDMVFAAAFVAGCFVLIYGGMILQMRQEYRRSAAHKRPPQP
jgi:hypothetical protein